MPTTQSPPRRLGLIGWLGGGRRGVEAYLYLLHRLSGLALLLFLSIHLFITGARLFGEEAWAVLLLSLIHISEPTRLWSGSRMPSSA